MHKELVINYIKFSVPLLLLLFLVMLPRTIAFQHSPAELSVGILLDLLITIPLIFYFLIRKTEIPTFTIIYPFLIGMVLAGIIIPIEHQFLLSRIKGIALPLVEIGIISLLLYKVKSLNASLKKTKEDDFYDKLLIACQEVFPNRMAKIVATEIAVIYYLFVSTKRKDITELEFTYFKKSGIKSVIGVFLFLISIETFVLHIVVARWNSTIAWVLSLIGVYTMIQIVAVLRSMNKRLITINYETQSLHLRYGFGCQTFIPFQSIERIEKSRKSITNDKGHVCLSLFDMVDSNNVIIYLKEENTLQKIYGIEKRYTAISLFVDEKDLFVESIEQISG